MTEFNMAPAYALMSGVGQELTPLSPLFLTKRHKSSRNYEFLSFKLFFALE